MTHEPAGRANHHADVSAAARVAGAHRPGLRM